jgi:geranylgeranyl pyrophosphate synthase
VLTGRSEADCLAMRQYGLQVGRAFQLVDDLLDYTATSEELGKPAFSDLREGKLTLPMLTLLEKAPDEVRAMIRTIWDRGEEVPIPVVEEAHLRALIAQHDALAETRELALKASQQAVLQLATVTGDAATGGLLREIPEALLSRSM